LSARGSACSSPSAWRAARWPRDASVSLAEIFFGELLQGFAVTHVALELLDSG
jgi:hypothetical protein